jgi:hypothetical protein
MVSSAATTKSNPKIRTSRQYTDPMQFFSKPEYLMHACSCLEMLGLVAFLVPF